MNVKFTLIGIVTFLLLPGLIVLADIAPDPGYQRISLKLVVETKEDLSDYRFFLISGDQVREVVLKKGETATIAPLGGGVRYSSGTLIAAPKKNLVGLREQESGGLLDEMQKAPNDRKVSGIVELVRHSFSREVRDAEASNWQDPVYRIEKDPQTSLRAVLVAGGADLSNTSANVSNGDANVKKIDNVASSGLRFWQSAAAAVVAGIFLLFGIAILGIWYFRKQSKQP